MSVLVTGGAGYIGSHTVVQLLRHDYHVVVVDNLINAHADTAGLPYSLRAVEKLTGKTLPFYAFDCRSESKLEWLFDTYNIKFVIHMANHRSVAMSMIDPIEYYDNNMKSTMVLLKVMAAHDVKLLIVSGSATVYGEKEQECTQPLREDMPAGCNMLNPYSQSKYFQEVILRDVAREHNMRCLVLRYFNPVGAHPSGVMGEHPVGKPICLLPVLSLVAIGRLPTLTVFGDNHPTKDGTCVRDYTHVMDVAEAHACAFQYMLNDMQANFEVINIGRGEECSMYDIISAYEQASGTKINWVMAARRPGDVSAIVSDSRAARQKLRWQPKYDLYDMCAHVHNWVSRQPDGYRTETVGERRADLRTSGC